MLSKTNESKSWVSKYLALLRAEGPSREALEEGLIQDPETARMFGRLDGVRQRKLLGRARREGQPLSHSEVARLDRAAGERQARTADDQQEGPGDTTSVDAGESDLPAETRSARVHVVQLTTDELRLLVLLLGGDQEDEGGLELQLLSLVAAIAARRQEGPQGVGPR